MAELGSATMVFDGDDAGFQQVASRVEGRMKDIGKGIGFSINIFLLNRLASGLGAMGKAAEEMSAKIRLSKASVGDLAEEVAKSIPIIGHFVQAGLGIKELITGEKAYTEVLKQQTEAQNERIRVTAGWIEAMKRMKREQEDLDRKLAPPGLGRDFSGIAAGVARQTEDLPAKLAEENKTQFDNFAKSRKELGEKLRNLQERNVPRSESSGAVGGRGFVVQPDPQIEKDIEATRRSITEIDKKSQALRDEMAKTEGKRQKDINVTGFSEAADAIGGAFTRGIKTAISAIDQFIPRLPKLESATQQAIDAAGGKLAAFQKQMAAFREDLGGGRINERTFDQISFQALNKSFGADFWKAAGDAIGNGFSSFQAAVDPKLGGLISNVREQMSNLLRTFGIGPKLSPATAPHPFRASFEGIEQLGRRIQEGAASGRDETMDGLLKAAEASLEEQKKQTALLTKQRGPIG